MMIGSLTNSTTTTATSTTSRSLSTNAPLTYSTQPTSKMNSHHSSCNKTFVHQKQPPQPQRMQSKGTTSSTSNPSTTRSVKQQPHLSSFMKTTSYSLSTTVGGANHDVVGMSQKNVLKTPSTRTTTTTSTNHNTPCHSKGSTMSHSGSIGSSNYATPLSTPLRPCSSSHSFTKSTLNSLSTQSTCKTVATTSTPFLDEFHTSSGREWSRGKTHRHNSTDFHCTSKSMTCPNSPNLTSLSPTLQPLSTSFVDQEHSLLNHMKRRMEKNDQEPHPHDKTEASTQFPKTLQVLEPLDDDLRILEEGFPIHCRLPTMTIRPQDASSITLMNHKSGNDLTNPTTTTNATKVLSSTSTTSPLLYIHQNHHHSLFEEKDLNKTVTLSTRDDHLEPSHTAHLNHDCQSIIENSDVVNDHTSSPNKPIVLGSTSNIASHHQPHHETSNYHAVSSCRNTISVPQKNTEIACERVVSPGSSSSSLNFQSDHTTTTTITQQQEGSSFDKKTLEPSVSIQQPDLLSSHQQQQQHDTKFHQGLHSTRIDPFSNPSTTALLSSTQTPKEKETPHLSTNMMKACMPSNGCGVSAISHHGNNTMMGKNHVQGCKKYTRTDCSDLDHQPTLEFVRVLLGQSKELDHTTTHPKQKATNMTVHPSAGHHHTKRSSTMNVLRYSYESDDEDRNAYELSPLHSNSKIYYVDQILSSGDKDCYEQSKDMSHDEDEALQEWERTKQKYKNAFKRRTNIPNPNNNNLSRNYSGNMGENLRMVTEKVCHLQQVKMDLEEQTQEIQNIWESLVHEDLVWQVEDLIVQSALCICGDLNSTKSIQTLFNMICETENEMVNALEDLIDFIFCSTRRSCKKHSINFNMILELVKDSSSLCANVLSKHQNHLSSQTAVALNSQRYKLDQQAFQKQQHTSYYFNNNKKTLMDGHTSQLHNHQPHHQKKNVTVLSPHSTAHRNQTAQPTTKHHALPAKMIPSSPQIQTNDSKPKRHISFSELENKESFLQLLGIGKRKELLESIRSIVEVLLEVSSVVLHSNEDKIESLDNSFKEMISTYSKIISDIEDFAPHRLFNVF
ncbi:hypothetical protein C9374_014286 [Naegleria lovaniensis]|uniref:Uncharacterized protein n=1 Tax=Naegleria lovaniensis TaxID=51637 RepID=A0AA88GBB0_NAELO|nr:uncharacterized protein C9374_014286 [Naegleria lovaniensis]KAG2370726.1 hypothetical protein C9374_014286 [Naegleria lovaniensis]